jgi:hypothetical protein
VDKVEELQDFLDEKLDARFLKTGEALNGDT